VYLWMKQFFTSPFVESHDQTLHFRPPEAFPEAFEAILHSHKQPFSGAIIFLTSLLRSGYQQSYGSECST